MSQVTDSVKRVAIAGNPNCGKSTLFNALTGMRQKVGNYPGVTVEKKEGKFFGPHGEPMDLLDLPGAYSLQSRSPDEAVSRDILLGRRADTPRPEVILCVVDASNLERHLYLVAQFLELKIPMVLALNMVDVAEQNGVVIDIPALSAKLGVTVIPTMAHKGKGLVEIKHALLHVPMKGWGTQIPMPQAWQEGVNELANALVKDHSMPEDLAKVQAGTLISLPSSDAVKSTISDPAIAQTIIDLQTKLISQGVDPINDPVEARYAWVQGVIDACVRRPEQSFLTMSDRLDAILTHRLWGWTIFLGTMALMFFCIFTVAEYPMGWIESTTKMLGDWVGSVMPDGDLKSLMVDGVIAGVGGVVIFLPQILILFFFIGLLEDTGYMARAAFIIDRVMSRVGLHGKSFIPMLGSFACAIPGIMATRTIENPKDRLVTILVAPLMSCSARLPVYTLLIAVLIPSDEVSALSRAGIMLSMYLVGMIAAFGMAWLFKKTLLRGETPMLLLELPPYRRPEMKAIALQMWQRASLFIKRAGTVILALSIVLWALATYPKHPNEQATTSEAIEYSIAGRMGKAIEPIIAPLGYDWKIGIGLISSFAAREVFVGTMAIVYNIEGAEDDNTPLRDAMRDSKRPDGTPVFTPLVCIGLMVFYVLAMQCISTIAIVRRETNSWRWPIFQVVYMTALAYVAALLVYQVGRWMGFS